VILLGPITITGISADAQPDEETRSGGGFKIPIQASGVEQTTEREREREGQSGGGGKHRPRRSRANLFSNKSFAVQCSAICAHVTIDLYIETITGGYHRSVITFRYYIPLSAPTTADSLVKWVAQLSAQGSLGKSAISASNMTFRHFRLGGADSREYKFNGGLAVSAPSSELRDRTCTRRKVFLLNRSIIFLISARENRARSFPLVRDNEQGIACAGDLNKYPI